MFYGFNSDDKIFLAFTCNFMCTRAATAKGLMKVLKANLRQEVKYYEILDLDGEYVAETFKDEEEVIKRLEEHQVAIITIHGKTTRESYEIRSKPFVSLFDDLK